MKIRNISIIFSFVCSPFFLQASACQIPEHPIEKPTLLLYYLPWCPYSQKVIRFLEEIHKTVPMTNLQKNTQGREDLQRIGGKMQVPCLIVNDCPLYESDAIIAWLFSNESLLDPA
jgi:glutaredoxin